MQHYIVDQDAYGKYVVFTGFSPAEIAAAFFIIDAQ